MSGRNVSFWICLSNSLFNKTKIIHLQTTIMIFYLMFVNVISLKNMKILFLLMDPSSWKEKQKQQFS